MHKMDQNPIVLIGPVSDDPAESVSGVNQALADGLRDRFTFIGSQCNRRHGETRQSRLNLWNFYYLLKHSFIWFANLMKHRPQIAHYAISSGFAMEKSFLLLALARTFGARTVGHLHSGGFLAHWKKLPSWRRRFAVRQLAKLDGLILLSERWRDRVVEQVGLDPRKLHVVNNPIAPSFEDQALAFPIERDRIRLLSLGTMGKDKGVMELVVAVASVARQTDGFMLDLIGPERDPGIRDEVAKELAARGLTAKVRIEGAVHGTDKLSLYREASIFILPSHYENFPLVILEAAAAGHAIIATPVGALPEFFENEVSALFVEIGNHNQLAEAITRLIRNAAERRRLAEAAREVFRRKLTRHRILSSLEVVYGELLPTVAPCEGAIDQPSANR